VKATQPVAWHLKPARPLGRRSALANFGAQGTALLCLTIASLVVARANGSEVLGEYALLRVLPWLTGIVLSLGLPMASAYFLAGARSLDARLRPTLLVLVTAAAMGGAAVWCLGAPLVRRWFFPTVPEPLLLLAAVCVVTQLVTVWAKACCQGQADLLGANIVIITEELWFLPAYGTAILLGLDGMTAVVAGLIFGGTLALATALGRLAQTGFFRDLGRPAYRLVREIAAFGARGELGNVLWLMNLRLDFLVLSVLGGPSALGLYAVASKFAELMRLPATAVNYVLYPRFAHAEPMAARADFRRLLPRAVLLTIAATPVLAVAVVQLLPRIYGSEFSAAVVPACVLLVGLAVEGAAAVASAYLWGIGRPGLNTAAMCAGVVVTVALDLTLIPGHGALGAAVASSAAYLLTTGLLTLFARRCSPVFPSPASVIDRAP